MKKAVKITLISLAALAVIAVCLSLFTGVPAYIITKNTLVPAAGQPCGDWKHYDAGTLSEYKTVSLDGLSLDVPVFVDFKTDSDGKVSDRILTSDKNGDHKGYVIILSERETNADSSVKELSENLAKLDKKQMDDFYRSFGKENGMETEYDFWDIALSADFKNCNILYRDQCSAYMIFYTLRSQLFAAGSGNISRFETETGKGFITPMTSSTSGKHMYSLQFFDKNDLNSYYYVTVTAPDDEEMCKIINSVRIDSK